MCWSRCKLYEDNNYQWWILGLWIWPRNISPVITIEDSGSPRPKYACQFQSKVRVMSTVFFDHKGVIRHEYAPDGQTVNKVYYVEVLCWLCDVVWRKQPTLWKRGDWQLHHDNVPTHLSRLVQNTWLNIRSHRCHILLIHWTWPHVTVFYSRRWKCCWRGISFKTWRR
jgi:hypothetical protein